MFEMTRLLSDLFWVLYVMSCVLLGRGLLKAWVTTHENRIC